MRVVYAYDTPEVLLVDEWRLGAVALGDVVPVAKEVAGAAAVADAPVLLWLGKFGTDTAARGGSFGKTDVKGR